MADSVYENAKIPHTVKAVKTESLYISLYHSGKCFVQGKKAADWVENTFEPNILNDPESDEAPEGMHPHMGIDESGKGDYFGPLVIASVYVDPETSVALMKAGVQDSKAIKSDAKSLELAREIKRITKNRLSVVRIGPVAYNRMFESVGNLNRLLAWGHAKAIENLLEIVPDCQHAVADQFGPRKLIEEALLDKGRKLILEQRTKAESDIAVAAASILARATFVDALSKLSDSLGIELPKGATTVKPTAHTILDQHGEDALQRVAKLHFKTTREILDDR